MEANGTLIFIFLIMFNYILKQDVSDDLILKISIYGADDQYLEVLYLFFFC